MIRVFYHSADLDGHCSGAIVKYRFPEKDGVDCGDIAKSFGGGGHFSASGFQCSELPFEY